MPKRLRYQVAASLDGFIADPHGGYDWIVADPTIDFGALFKEFDTAVMGRKTYESGIVVLAYSVKGSKAAAPKIRYSKSKKARQSRKSRKVRGSKPTRGKGKR